MRKILIIQPIHKAGIELLKNNKNYEFEIIEDIEISNINSKIINCDAISIRTANLPAEAINAAKNLQIISRHGVGYDNVDINFLKKKNISLLVTGTTASTSPAEHIMFMILNISKGKDLHDRSVRNGKFDTIMHMNHQTFELFGKKILIVGFGRIGRKLIKKCLGFDMKVYVYDPFVNKEIIESFGGKKITNFDNGLKETDVLSLSVPLNKETNNMINLEKMKIMKKTSVIINISRGGVVNEKDLSEALNSGLIYGAGLDVFQKEPPSSDNPLLTNKKVLLSPHAATFTRECISDMAVQTAQNIIDFFENKLNKSMIVKL